MIADVPEVSVVIGAHDAEAQIERTLRSVLSQEGCALEAIVVDDGSRDATPAVLDRLAREDSRLRILRQENAGLTRALIAGCAQARAAFIARQDAGDASLPGRFRRQLDALRADPHLAFVSCGTRYLEAGGGLLYEQHGSGRTGVAAQIIDLAKPHGISDGPTHHGSVMFRADAYRRAGGYRAQFYFGQDWDLWYRLAEAGSFMMIGETLYEATVGIGDISTSHKPEQEALAKLSLQALHLRQQGLSDEPALIAAQRIRPRRGAKRPAASYAAAAYFIGECLRRNGNASRARDYFVQALRAQPWHAKSWVRLVQSTLEAR